MTHMILFSKLVFISDRSRRHLWISFLLHLLLLLHSHLLLVFFKCKHLRWLFIIQLILLHLTFWDFILLLLLHLCRVYCSWLIFSWRIVIVCRDILLERRSFLVFAHVVGASHPVLCRSHLFTSLRAMRLMPQRFSFFYLLINIKWLLVKRSHAKSFVRRLSFVSNLDIFFVGADLAHKILKSFSLYKFKYLKHILTKYNEHLWTATS